MCRGRPKSPQRRLYDIAFAKSSELPSRRASRTLDEPGAPAPDPAAADRKRTALAPPASTLASQMTNVVQSFQGRNPPRTKGLRRTLPQPAEIRENSRLQLPYATAVNAP